MHIRDVGRIQYIEFLLLIKRLNDLLELNLLLFVRDGLRELP